jgi:coenzyme F420-reducing hydrogenase gamma subunit
MSDKEIKKLRVGWFTFTCCEDSTIVFTEVLNDHWKEWRKLIDFVHARVLQKKNAEGELDVAFIEGAISSEEQKKRVEEIRKKSTWVVAVGACAVSGMPSSQRNQFDEGTLKEIHFIMERFHHLEKVLSVKEVVKVDAELPGCPMDPKQFVETVNKALAHFGVVPAQEGD